MKKVGFLDHNLENTKVNWNVYWNSLDKSSVLNRLFVFVRYNIIAGHVAHSLDRYFPKEGVFLDSGCGTSQTSVKIPKRQRKFVAMDIAEIIFSKHPGVVDHKVNGDVFKLPFKDGSFDGLWNVGLMEHFQPKELDTVLSEFNRVLKKGSNAVLFWPPAYGPVNLVLKSSNFFKKVFKNGKDDMFLVEPSLIKSRGWVKNVVERNNFSLVSLEWSLRGAFIHYMVVIKKL